MRKIINSVKKIIYLLLIIINVIFLTNSSELNALPQAEYGQWVTYSGPSGELTEWWCEASGDFECVVGETGSGYRP